MADPVASNEDDKQEENATKEVVVLPKPKKPAVLNGVSSQLDGELHYGVSVYVTSGAGLSTLSIPDVTGVANGKAPIFITKPVGVRGDKFKTFLDNKKITLPSEISRLLKTTKIGVSALYFTNNQYPLKEQPPGSGKKVPDKDKPAEKIGPVLMNFEIDFEEGLIGALTGDESFNDIFDIQGASLRIIRSSKEEFPLLQAYVNDLTS